MTTDNSTTPIASQPAPSAPPPASRLTWRRCALIVLLTMGAGLTLAVLRPVWLAPPLFVYTPLMYVMLALAWVPMLAICALLRPTGDRPIPTRLMLLGLLLSLFWCLLFCPSTNIGTLTLGSVDCRHEPSPEGQVRYTCTSVFYLSYITYKLEGPEGWPFVRLIEMRIDDS